MKYYDASYKTFFVRYTYDDIDQVYLHKAVQNIIFNYHLCKGFNQVIVKIIKMRALLSLPLVATEQISFFTL